MACFVVARLSSAGTPANAVYLFGVQILNLLSNGIQCFVNFCIVCVRCGVLPVTYHLLLLIKLFPSGDLSCQLLYMYCSFPFILFYF